MRQKKDHRQSLADGDEIASTLARLNRSKPGSVIYSRGDLQRKDAVTRGPFLNSTVSSSNGMLVGTMSRSELPPRLVTLLLARSLQVISMRDELQPSKRAGMDTAFDALATAVETNVRSYLETYPATISNWRRDGSRCGWKMEIMMAASPNLTV